MFGWFRKLRRASNRKDRRTRSYSRINVTVPQDLERLREVLSSRYTPASLVRDVIRMYGDDFVNEWGILGATTIFLKEYRYDMGLKISDTAIENLAEAFVQRGAVVG